MKTTTFKNPADADSVAVVVLNHNKKNELLEALKSMRNIHYGAFEVVVVDNGSTDGSVRAVPEVYPEVHLVQSSRNLGAPAGRNLGIGYVK